jgi:hypothetical protein
MTRFRLPRPGLRPSVGAVLAALAWLSAPPARGSDDLAGEQIYRQHCARCHGTAGEGTKRYQLPLIGDKSVMELARLITKTMPEDDPEKCVGPDAEKVAAYIHETFYSPEAQARNKPARIELSRLTVRQYRNAVADLVGSFRGPPARIDDQRGLRAEYYKSRRFRPNEREIARIDPEVRFDFGTASPEAGKLDPYEFSIRWEGSVLPPETGDYEFVIRTEHAARLWVNDPARPLIDAWVKSGDDTEHRASIYLLAGRAYTLRLEFSKANQGVVKKDEKRPPVPASIALLWRPPHRAPEVVPQRHLSPNRAPEAFVVETRFPPDDRSLGWERGSAVSRAWDAATTDAAIETAAYVAANIDELAGVRGAARRGGPGSGNPAAINLDGPKAEADPARTAKLRDFCYRFAERAFRRPLTPEQKHQFIDRQFDEAKDADTAVKRAVLLVLKSPRFLYRELGGGPDAYDVAARLSFALWDSIPDDELLKAAAEGRLATREQVARQAERMLADLRAREKLHHFLHVWLKVDHHPDLAKDPKRFPGFDAEVASDLRASLDLFLHEVLSADAADFRRLLLDDHLYLNGRLAKVYGADLPADAPFTKVKLNPDDRAGVLTHPYLMAAFAYTGSTSPIHRGVFVARGVLGRMLRTPPEAFTPLPEDLHPELTTRERVALQTRPQACASCHQMINPLGFTLEHFDAIGRYREEDNGKPVDASGVYLTSGGETVKLNGARELGRFLAGSPEVQTSFAEQLFHHLAQQPVRAYGPGAMEDLAEAFARGDYDIRKLAVEVAVTAALTGREKKPPGG